LLNLDTHVLLYALSGDLKLAERTVLAASPRVPLLTRDRRIRRSKLVPLA
jgi:hypothetical protein